MPQNIGLNWKYYQSLFRWRLSVQLATSHYDTYIFRHMTYLEFKGSNMFNKTNMFFCYGIEMNNVIKSSLLVQNESHALHYKWLINLLLIRAIFHCLETCLYYRQLQVIYFVTSLSMMSSWHGNVFRGLFPSRTQSIPSFMFSLLLGWTSSTTHCRCFETPRRSCDVTVHS